MSDSDEAKGLSPVPRPLTGVRTQPPARGRLGVNPRSLRPIPVINDVSLEKSSSNLEERVDSFYEFPTAVNVNVNKTTAILPTAPGTVKIKPICLVNTKKPPSWNEVYGSCLEHDIYEKRTTDVKAYGVAFSQRNDADASSAITLGTDTVNINWINDLPPFQSKFEPTTSGPTNLCNDALISLKRISRPPSYDSVLEWCGSISIMKAPMAEKSKENDAHDSADEQNDFNKTCVRVRQNSEDSIGSDISLSPPTSPIHGPEVIEKSTVDEPIKRNQNSMMISGQTLGSSELGSGAERHNTLQGVTEANDFYHLTLFSVEIFVSTRQQFLPDPEFDSVTAIFYAVWQDGPKQNTYGIIATDSRNFDEKNPNHLLTGTGSSFDGKIVTVATEAELFENLIRTVGVYCPDILIGYEIQRSSWGYLCRRAANLNINLTSELSRMPKSAQSRFAGPNGASDIDAELYIAGRILLNVWKLLRGEVTLTSYSFENVFFQVMKRRVAKFSHETLTKMWSSNHTRWMVVEYMTKRVVGTLEILDKLDLTGRTAELAKLFGIQFLEVLSRGSQFRVESIMLRLVRAKNLVPVSPTIQQRAKMKAPQYIPLVMEPESRMYNDPVIVLDFASLYPSIIMAYNYCYSTSLGHIVDHMKNGEPNKPFEFGCTHLKISPSRLAKLKGQLNFAPGGIAFVKESVRKGILPKMLQELLDTRVMVKNSMKLHNKLANQDPDLKKRNVKLQKMFHSRQLGLKLIANVTYGYTSANFSGRMPCIDVGDSVVSKGRETLERAIKTIEGLNSDGKPTWPGAKVVYGDTDSLFVLLPGRSKSEAFDIGEDMAKTVTQENPKPVKLKFEKVYYPCILQTKKRYVGYMYETRDQEKPKYDAKGIETVRRDGVPAVVKMLEKSLRILFETKNVSLVKRYVQSQMCKIASGRISLQELTFAREFRGLHGYRPGACVPALELTRRFCKVDRMRIPNIGERVPYVIIYGEPGKPLIQSVRSPDEVLKGKWLDAADCQNAMSMRPNAAYYITKVIVPALSRCLSLVGADVMSWSSEMPKLKSVPRLLPYRHHQSLASSSSSSGGVRVVGGVKGVIPHYFVGRQCPICLERAQTIQDSSPICSDCEQDPNQVAKRLSQWICIWDTRIRDLDQACRNCDVSYDSCRSLDCPRLYLRTEAKYDAGQIEVANQILKDL